jgi:RNA polymerase sigma factor for flagellar operon FliA
MLPKIKVLAMNVKATLPKSVEVSDLIQEGVVALINAFDRYDETKGASFSTFALTRVKGAMYDYLRNIDWLPRKTRHQIKEIERAYFELEANKGSTPTEEEVAAYLSISIDEVRTSRMDMNCKQLLDLDNYLSPDESEFTDSIVSEEPTPEQHYEREEKKEHLKALISELPEREQLVISLYYTEELNLKEIALILGVTESRVSQVLSKTLRTLKFKIEEAEKEEGRQLF